MSPLPRTAIVLVGGKGTRLRSVVADRPKPLAEVRGRPFVRYVLDAFAEVGLERVILCAGHLAEQVGATLGTQHRGLELLYSVEPEARGTAGAIGFARRLLRDEDHAVLVANGDSFCGVDLEAFGIWHAQRQASSSLVVTEVADRRSGGVLEVDGDRVVAFREKEGEGPGLVNAGIYLCDRDTLELCPDDRPASLEREIFPRLTDGRLLAYRTTAELLDIGTPERLASAEAFFSARGIH